jgi:hypothetical protein
LLEQLVGLPVLCRTMRNPVAWCLLAGWVLCAGACRPMQVQFRNSSAETFTRVDANLLGTSYSFDTLRPGQLSRRVAVPATYYYCTIRAVTAHDTLHYQPVDYVGEKRYRRGKMTIELDIKTGQHRQTGQPVRHLAMDADRGRRWRAFKQWWDEFEFFDF